ncbi:MAG: hypothetical protein KBT28_12375 [Bacteroidales bacterium]|nr:hypothetical protein [Candidatus Colimorpha merdihippi]
MAGEVIGGGDIIRKKLETLDSKAKGAISDVISRVGASDVDKLREAIFTEIMPICENAAALSAQLAADAYNGWRLAQIGEPYAVSAESSFDEGSFSSAANKALSSAKKGEGLDSVINVMNSRAGYEVRASYSKTMFSNAKNDPRPPMLARVPSMNETCDFCLMLASNGFFYVKGKAGEKVHNHDNCQCVYQPSWSKDPRIKGYDPDECYDKWKSSIDAKAKAAAERKGTSVGEERDRIMSWYRNSSTRAKKNAVGKYATKVGGKELRTFNDVKDLVYSANSKTELEHIYSQLGAAYGMGSEQMTSQSMKNVFRHMEKRLGNNAEAIRAPTITASVESVGQRRFPKPTKASREALQAASDEWYSNLDVGPKTAVHDYTVNHFRLVNPYLRSGASGDAELDEFISYLDNAIGQFELNKSMTVFRGDDYKYYSGIKKGETVTFDAYFSTATKRGVADDYADTVTHKGGEGFVFEVRVPAGTQCAYIGNNSSADEKGGPPNEYELLLGHGLRYYCVEHNSMRLILEVVKDE